VTFSHHILKIALLISLINGTLYAISFSDFINDKDCSQIIDKDFLTICYSYDLKSALAVSYTLEGDLVNELNIKNRPNFTLEILLESHQRASYSDYTNSGYDRGHLAPDASFDWSNESLRATYSLANIIPQVPEVNRLLWVKAESYARDMAIKLGSVNILNIVKYAEIPKRIGDNNIAVPSAYYKVLFSKEKEYEQCFYYQNIPVINTSNDTLLEHEVSCASLYSQEKKDYGFLVPIITILSL
jgi:endonuclease G